mmetsp:Transcript_8926/g.21778  ORF Transcript_8926/g.21778 Transcript_8926/m.21778 type:complete len:392 (+) Transcript_8926:225-1400(+)
MDLSSAALIRRYYLPAYLDLIGSLETSCVLLLLQYVWIQHGHPAGTHAAPQVQRTSRCAGGRRRRWRPRHAPSSCTASRNFSARPVSVPNPKRGGRPDICIAPFSAVVESPRFPVQPLSRFRLAPARHEAHQAQKLARRLQTARPIQHRLRLRLPHGRGRRLPGHDFAALVPFQPFLGQPACCAQPPALVHQPLLRRPPLKLVLLLLHLLHHRHLFHGLLHLRHPRGLLLVPHRSLLGSGFHLHHHFRLRGLGLLHLRRSRLLRLLAGAGAARGLLIFLSRFLHRLLHRLHLWAGSTSRTTRCGLLLRPRPVLGFGPVQILACPVISSAIVGAVLGGDVAIPEVVVPPLVVVVLVYRGPAGVGVPGGPLAVLVLDVGARRARVIVVPSAHG